MQIDKGLSNSHIAKNEKISEGSIRYCLKNGKLKKKQPLVFIATNSQRKPNINDITIENSSPIFEKDCKKKIYLS